MANILLIDDDRDILKFSEAVLRAQGHEIYLAENADQAMDHIKGQVLHLVLCDVNMPHISGFDLLNHIRQQPKYRNLPIALLTSRRDKEDVQKAISLGVSGYIVKPINPELLIEKVNTLIKEKPATTNVYEFSENFKPHADVTVALKINSISDQEIVFESETPILEGVFFSFSTSIFSQMGIEKLSLKVTSCEAFEEKFVVKAELNDVDEQYIRRINAWVRARLKENEAKKAA